MILQYRPLSVQMFAGISTFPLCYSIVKKKKQRKNLYQSHVVVKIYIYQLSSYRGTKPFVRLLCFSFSVSLV